MDLKLFFDPISLETSSYPETSFCSSIYVNSEIMPEHEDMDIAADEFAGATPAADQLGRAGRRRFLRAQ